MSRRRGAVLINSVLGVALLAGAGAAYAVVNDGDGTSSKTSSGGRIVSVSRGEITATVSGSGNLSSSKDVGLDFTTGGTVSKVKVKVGEKVEKGQLLAKVDDTSAQADLKSARSSLTAAEDALTQAEKGTAATTTVDASAVARAKANVTTAENDVATAKKKVAGTVLKATEDGTVASISGGVGDTVSGSGASSGSSSGSSGSPSGGSSSGSSSTPSGFVVLTNPSGMKIDVDFSESDVLKVKAGQKAAVTLSAESGTTLKASVESVSPLPISATSSNGQGSSSAVEYEAVLDITSSTKKLRTGMSATVEVTTGSAKNALSVPSEAVTGSGSNKHVTVVSDDGTKRRVTVRTGLVGDETTQITKGLSAGEKVFVASTKTSNGFTDGTFPGGNARGGGGMSGGPGRARGGFGGGRP